MHSSDLNFSNFFHIFEFLAVFYLVIFYLIFVISNLIFNLGQRATGLSVFNCYVLPSINKVVTYLLTGDAKESIQGLITLDSPDPYDKARKVLKERFGHPYCIAQAYKDKLNAWPPIREEDGMRFQQFDDFIVICEQAMKTLKYMEGLNLEDTLKRVTSRLPSSMGVR